MTFLNTEFQLDATMPNDLSCIIDHWKAYFRDRPEVLIYYGYRELGILTRFYLGPQAEIASIQPYPLIDRLCRGLIEKRGRFFQNRIHFFDCARAIMHQLILQRARVWQSRLAVLDSRAVSGSSILGKSANHPEHTIALSQLLGRLGAVDPRKQAMVEMYRLLALTLPEIAEVLGLSLIKLRQEWQTAKSWIVRDHKHLALSSPSFSRIHQA